MYYHIKGNIGDSLLLFKTGMKYISSNDKEYYIDSELLDSDNFDFVIYASDIFYYEDYERQSEAENVEVDLFQKYNKERNEWIGYFKYKETYNSRITDHEKNIILNRIIELCRQENIKIDIVKKDDSI